MPDQVHAELALGSASREPGLRLGILDLCPSPPGTSGRAALFDSLEQAVRADELGYSRYWLAEHHGPGTSHGSPELLAALIAQMTQRIRVGTAGILLSYYSPLKVAKDFRLLQALFPGRIDLGLGAGRVDDETARGLLGETAPVPDYDVKVHNLLAYLRDESLPIMPSRVGQPDLWLLGSGGIGSARLAAQHGTAYSLALFLAGSKDDPGIIEAYRAAFRPSRELARPQWNVAVAGICAETDEEAERITALSRNRFLLPTVIGSPERCRARLLDIAQRYQTDEVIFLTCAGTPAQRQRSYQLLAEVFELGRNETGAGQQQALALRA